MAFFNLYVLRIHIVLSIPWLTSPTAFMIKLISTKIVTYFVVGPIIRYIGKFKKKITKRIEPSIVFFFMSEFGSKYCKVYFFYDFENVYPSKVLVISSADTKIKSPITSSSSSGSRGTCAYNTFMKILIFKILNG